MIKSLLGIDLVLLEEVQVLVPLVADNLKHQSLQKLTLPQVKHLTGMIILDYY